MPAQSRRLLFVQARHPASIAPIYLAVLSLVFLGLVALLVTWWPLGKGARPPYGAGEAQVAPAGGSAQRGLRIPPGPRKPGARAVSM